MTTTMAELRQPELLERDEALEALANAFAQAEQGEGRVVLVSGEPGIGKSTLVDRFVADLDADTPRFTGACDDLSIPRPLSPLRDFADELSPPLAEAIKAGAAAQIHRLLLDEIE